jgi:hypothetical protein
MNYDTVVAFLARLPGNVSEVLFHPDGNVSKISFAGPIAPVKKVPTPEELEADFDVAKLQKAAKVADIHSLSRTFQNDTLPFPVKAEK